MSLLKRPLRLSTRIEPLKRISVEQYHAMIRAGVFDDDDAIELLDGLMVEKMTKKPLHSVATGLVFDALTGLLPPGWILISQEPITTEESEPEPDIGVVRGKRRDYVARHPVPAEIGLVVEVADTTLVRDRGVKKAIYARARIETYWIINLVNRWVEVFTNPTGSSKKPEYRKKAIYRMTDSVPLILDGKELGRMAVKDLLP